MRSRAEASCRKINLKEATHELIDLDMEEEPEGGLERLYRWIRAHNFSKWYSSYELEATKLEFLKWVGENLAVPRGIGTYQLCLLGPAESRKTLFCNMISSFLNVFFVPPTLDCFEGAEGADLWIIDGCSSTIFNKSWARSASGVQFGQMLDGQPMSFRWGPNNEFSYLKDRNDPISNE